MEARGGRGGEGRGVSLQCALNDLLRCTCGQVNIRRPSPIVKKKKKMFEFVHTVSGLNSLPAHPALLNHSKAS